MSILFVYFSGRVEKPSDELASQFEQLLKSYSLTHVLEQKDVTNTAEWPASENTESDSFHTQNIVTSCESNPSSELSGRLPAKGISYKSVGIQTEGHLLECLQEKPLPSRTVKVPLEQTKEISDKENSTIEKLTRIKEEQGAKHERNEDEMNLTEEKHSNTKRVTNKKRKLVDGKTLRKRKRISYVNFESSDEDNLIKSEPLNSDSEYQPFYGDLLSSPSEDEGNSLGFDAIDKLLSKSVLKKNVSRLNSEQDEESKTTATDLGKMEELETVKSEVNFMKSGGRWDCNICGASYKDKRSLIEHTRSHTGELPYKCLTCQKAFTRKRTLRRHERTHSKFDAFKDDFKNEMGNDNMEKRTGNVDVENKNKNNNVKSESRNDFGDNENGISPHTSSDEDDGGNAADLEALEKAAEKLENPDKTISVTRGPKRQKVNGKYVCLLCGASYNQVRSLVEHERTHTGELPYKCTLCSKAFTRKGETCHAKKTGLKNVNV